MLIQYLNDDVLLKLTLCKVCLLCWGVQYSYVFMRRVTANFPYCFSSSDNFKSLYSIVWPHLTFAR